MTDTLLVEQSQGYYVLQGDLDRSSVPRWESYALSQLQSFQNIHPNEKVRLDFSGVKHSDTAGLAWLINLLKSCRELGLTLELVNLPETILNLAKISDVDSFLSVE